MDKEAISKLIDAKHQNLIAWLDNQPENTWEYAPKDKWTTGQHILHLTQSAKPLNTALSLPRFFLRYKFGKSNRAVRDYDSVVKRYNERLEEFKGATFRGSQNMKIPSVSDKKYIINKLHIEHKKLQYKTQKLSDKMLDTYVLPHPLMGKMPINLSSIIKTSKFD